MKLLRYLMALLIAATVLNLTAPQAHAEGSAKDYPQRPVTLIVPYPAGGFVDRLARIIANQFKARTGGTMIVESRAGRDGIVGSHAVARAQPDGYTLLMGDSNPLTVAPLIHASLPYDSMRDFTRIATITSSNPIMVARVESPLRTVADVVATAKARPGKMTYGSGTVGQQLMGEMLKVRANISIVHVPYRGGSQAMTDTLGGHVDFATTASANYIGLRGKLVALGIASGARFKNLPEVPTMVEQGYPGFVTGSWLGILGPRDMLPTTVVSLTSVIRDIVRSEEFEDFALKAGNEVEFHAGDAFTKRMLDDREILAPIVKAAGITAD